MNTNHQPAWRRSTRCGTSSCVEVAKVGDEYLVRDSKNPSRDALSFTKEEWVAFVAGVAAGDFVFE
jgi:predicted secreted Zn-dependent protease